MFGFEIQQGLNSTDPEKYRKQTWLISAHTKFHTLSLSTEEVIQKEPESEQLADFGEPSREAEVNWDSLGDGDNGSTHLGELILWQ